MHERSKLVAHRGFASKYPENTIEALNAAVQLGVKNVEIDVQLTKDLVPVMLHDENFKRTLGKDLSVFVNEATQLKGVETLEEVVSWLLVNESVTAFIELKQESITRFGVGTCVRSIAQTCQPVISRCVFISFNAAACGIAKPSGFEKMGWVLPTYDKFSKKILNGLRPNFLFCDKDYLAEEELWDGPWKWVVYEVENKEQANNLIEKGVDYIDTMKLDELID